MTDYYRELAESYPTIRRYAAEDGPRQDRERGGVVRLRRGELRPSLFDYQDELTILVREWLAEPPSRALIALPTGAGKTRTAVTAILDALASGRCSNVLWLAPTRELLDQAEATMRSLWHASTCPDVDLVRDFSRNGVESTSRVTLATPQKAYSAIKQRTALQAQQLVVFDEAHQLGARTFKKAVEGVERLGPTHTLGLSATPGRGTVDETDELVEWFGRRLLVASKLGREPIRTLQRRGVLARFRFKTLKRRAGKAGETIRALEKIRDLVGRGNRVLAFATSVEEAEAIAAALVSVDIAAAPVSSRTAPEQRRQRIADFSDGRLSVLTNYRVLATGYDCPGVGHAVVLGRVTSAILFEQIVGRVARGPTTGGTPVGYVWQFADHLSLHGLPSSYYRYSDFDWSNAVSKIQPTRRVARSSRS